MHSRGNSSVEFYCRLSPLATRRGDLTWKTCLFVCYRHRRSAILATKPVLACVSQGERNVSLFNRFLNGRKLVENVNLAKLRCGIQARSHSMETLVQVPGDRLFQCNSRYGNGFYRDN